MSGFRLDLSRLGGWAALPFFAEGGIAAVEARLAAEQAEILPPAGEIFAALELTPPERVRAVILGQDPYPTPGDANGLAFSVHPGQALPRSLRNIHAELATDLGRAPPNGDLRPWARAGVLLLNSVLTVPAGQAGGHQNRIGWEPLAREVLELVSRRPTAFLLWGARAQALASHIHDDPRHLVIRTAHPSPLSARRGFFGSRPFSRVNAWLGERGEPEIAWV
ncbi:uracil-DNA glycosylase [Paralimibaculum aggregatum]|uniref:Uracil-DNA glycosylase n=1 Tax=Paralimibaculum aggregatum TaxID=3036245 RepID=A0ABQ6LK94_9RHOB|nr:uracil-DNA glycosylase [Limibaculum sp. NKW23]GMG83672.1 uracil-DNA glycosylase [Limibaculum sp. NKW23]